MKRKYWPLLATGVSSLVVACGMLSGTLTDAENRSVLTDVSGETWGTNATGGDTGGGSGENQGTPGSVPAECHGNPVKDNCGDDIATYCPDLAPSDDGVPPESRCGRTFDERQSKREALMDCLQENLASLSTACQDVVNHAPPKPSDAGNEHYAAGQGSDSRPHRRPPMECGGQSRLKDCIADARTLCEAELPIPGEPDGFTPDERKQRVDAIVACLRGQSDSVSAACQADLDALPAAP